MARPRFRSACIRLRPGNVCAALVLALLPSASAAQQTAFSQTLSELTAAIDGTYGDEGTLVRPAIDRLTAGARGYTLDIVTNATRKDRRVVRRRLTPDGRATQFDTTLEWPETLVSVGHVALPFRGNSADVRNGKSALPPVNGHRQVGHRRWHCCIITQQIKWAPDLKSRDPLARLNVFISNQVTFRQRRKSRDGMYSTSMLMPSPLRGFAV